jgi:hypothetical protein
VAVPLPLVALAPQWRQNYPKNRPPRRATTISEMGQQRKLQYFRKARIWCNFNQVPSTRCTAIS